MEWLIWMLAIWFVMSVVGRGGCSRSWSAHDRRRIRSARAAQWKLDRLSAGRAAGAGIEARTPVRRSSVPARPKETAEERIRRRFVEGRTTLEEYEAELWEELRPR